MTRFRRRIRRIRVHYLIRMQMHSSTQRICLSSRPQLEALCLMCVEMPLPLAGLLLLSDVCSGSLLV